ncbi:MAG: AMP-binding protein [Desulfobacterales bacterium]|nr:AMP-binding protein [Desulfobacterales bacterium]
MKTTIMQEFQETADRFKDKPAMMAKVNGQWEAITWKDYHEQVRTTAQAFMALGLEKGKSVSILSFNCPQWYISNLAAIFAGGMPSGIYATSSPEQCKYIAEHSEANIIVVENAEQLAKILQVKEQLPDLKAIVLMNGNALNEKVIPWNELSRFAGAISEEELNARINEQNPDDCCELIYTSGTTGPPKAVMLSHDNIIWTARQLVTEYEVGHDAHALSYLPLSHIYEQIGSYYSSILKGFTVWFAESFEQLKDNLVEVRPTLFLGVPRVWEKIEEAMITAGSQNSGLKKKIAAWARKKGLAGAYAHQDGNPIPFMYGLAGKLVFSKVRQKLGFDRCRYFISAAAPIGLATLEFFSSLEIQITEVYGMSECTGPSTFSVPQTGKYRIGFVGLAVPGTELAIAEDGEILTRGRHVFKGYYKNEAATYETIDENGWLHTGDVGELGVKGFLKVTDRKKELIITAGGENIAPQVIEGKLKMIPEVSQAAVIGDRRKYLSALLSLKPEQLKDLIRSAGSSAKDMVEAAQCKRCNEFLQNRIDAVNTTLPQVQAIKKFFVLPSEMTVETGELTPTMKLKRRIIYEKYANEIEQMYA